MLWTPFPAVLLPAQCGAALFRVLLALTGGAAGGVAVRVVVVLTTLFALWGGFQAPVKTLRNLFEETFLAISFEKEMIEVECGL